MFYNGQTPECAATMRATKLAMYQSAAIDSRHGLLAASPRCLAIRAHGHRSQIVASAVQGEGDLVKDCSAVLCCAHRSFSNVSGSLLDALVDGIMPPLSDSQRSKEAIFVLSPSNLCRPSAGGCTPWARADPERRREVAPSEWRSAPRVGRDATDEASPTATINAGRSARGGTDAN